MAFLFLDGFPNHCLLAGIMSLFMLEPAFLLLFFFLSFYLTARIYSCNCSTQYLWNSCVIPALFLGRLRHRTLGEFHLKDKLNRNRVQKAHLYYSLSFKVNGTVVNCHLQQAYIQFVLCVCLYMCVWLIMCVCVWSVCVGGQLSDTMIFCNHLGEYKKDELLEAAR